MDEKPNKKEAASSAEEVATWLARETGHTDVPEEGYGEPESMNLPAKRRKDLGSFFDGLHVEKAMQEKRRQQTVDAVDEIDGLRQAIQPPAVQPQGPPNAPTY